MTSFHLIQQTGKVFKVAGIDVEIQQIAVAIEELVGRPAVDVQVALDSRLLFIRQVVVGTFGPLTLYSLMTFSHESFGLLLAR